MHKPKYDLLEEIHYFRDGKLFCFKIENILYARDGIFPFEDLPDVIYYTDGNEIIPESLAHPTARKAVQDEIRKLNITLDSIPEGK